MVSFRMAAHEKCRETADQAAAAVVVCRGGQALAVTLALAVALALALALALARCTHPSSLATTIASCYVEHAVRITVSITCNRTALGC